MIGVIALLTLLLVLLTGLTRGLAHQNISAIEELPADAVVLTPTLGDSVSWADSQITTDQAATWEDTPGLGTEPLSVGQLQVGMLVHILHVPKSVIPLSASVLDPSVYPVCERAMGIELARYALEGVNAKP